MLTVHKIYKTYGGWEAQVIWKCFSSEDSTQSFLVIHSPGTPDESAVITHDEEGCAQAAFSINEPPTYGVHHPADLIIED